MEVSKFQLEIIFFEYIQRNTSIWGEKNYRCFKKKKGGFTCVRANMITVHFLMNAIAGA